MTRYETNKSELRRHLFFEIFKDISKEDQLKLINTLSKIIKVVK